MWVNGIKIFFSKKLIKEINTNGIYIKNTNII